MLELILSILALSVASAASPVIFAIAVSLLSGKAYPIRRTVAFLLGGVVVAAILVIIGSEFGSGTLRISSTSYPKALVDVALSALMIAFALYEFLQKPSTEKVGRPASSQTGRLFLLGIFVNITNFDAILLNLTAVREAASSHIAAPLEFFLIAIADFFFLSPALLPLIICVIYPTRSQSLLKPIGAITTKYGAYVVSAIFFIFGIYLIWRSGIVAFPA